MHDGAAVSLNRVKAELDRAARFLCIISCVFSLSSSNVQAWAADAADTSSAANSVGAAGDSSRLLNGSAKDKAELTPSVKLLPPEKQTHLLNGNANVKQFNGQAQSTPGRPVYPAQVSMPAYTPVRQYPRTVTPILPARIYVERPHTPFVYPAVPKWNYTLTPKNGIMTWAPGYGSTRVAQQMRVQPTPVRTATFAPQVIRGTPFGAGIVPGAHPSTDTGVKMLQKQGVAAVPAAEALRATPELFTEPHSSTMKRSVTWGEWYKRVCTVIYDQWKLDGACPGKATVQVTVWPGRDIEGKVLNFTAVSDAARDATQETAFRETALRAINSLRRTETLDFPEQTRRTKVVFDLDMNRSVNGPSGCQVAAFHDTENFTEVVRAGSAARTAAAPKVKGGAASKPSATKHAKTTAKHAVSAAAASTHPSKKAPQHK